MPDPPAPEPPLERRQAAPRPRHRRRWLKWVGLAILGAAVIFVGSRLAVREAVRVKGNRELSAAVAEVNRSDPDWTWERLNATRKRPPEGKNGAELIPQIKKLTHPDWGKELAKEEWEAQLEVPANVRFSPRVIAQVRGELNASADAVKLARTLKDHPYGHREIHLEPVTFDTLLEDTVNTRHAADLLKWDAVVAVEDGDTRRAVDDLHSLLNASRSIGDEPSVVSQMIRIALRIVAVRRVEWVLAQGVNVSNLAELQAAFAADAEEPLLLNGMRGERAMIDRLFENLDSGVAAPEALAGGRATPSVTERLGWWLHRAHLPADRAFALTWMSLCVEYARLPIHEQEAAFATLPVVVKDKGRIISGLVRPVAQKVVAAHLRGVAESRCTVVGIACERFRQKHNRWPESLAELVPAFLSAVPLDPFDGQPLRYAKSKEGAAVYSVGKRPPSQFGANPAVPPGLPEGVEIGFRLWNPDQRRLPPLPEPIEPRQEP